jgi:hypothetical protein
MHSSALAVVNLWRSQAKSIGEKPEEYQEDEGLDAVVGDGNHCN